LPNFSASDDGVYFDNERGKKTEPLISVARLKAEFLTGLNITDPTTGEELPDSTYQAYIDQAVGMLEAYLDISISPVYNFVEYKSHYKNEYQDFGFFMMNNYPLSDVEEIALTYFREFQRLGFV